MNLNDVLESPKPFDVFYKFVLNWEKNQSWKRGYATVVEFLEMMHVLYPTIGRCARNFFPTFAFTKAQKWAAALSKYDLVPSNCKPYSMKNLEDVNWAFLAYAVALDKLRDAVWNEFANSPQGQSIQAELYVVPQAPAVNSSQAASSSAAVPSAGSPVAKVAIAPGAFRDKPVAISVTPEGAETLLRLRIEDQLGANSNSLGALFGGSQDPSAVSTKLNPPSATKFQSPPAAAKIPFPASQRARIDPNELKPRSKVLPPLPPLPNVSAIARSKAVEVALGLPPAVRSSAMVGRPVPPPLPPLPRRKVVPHIQIKRSAQAEIGSLIDSIGLP